jgi:hypothetical protein
LNRRPLCLLAVAGVALLLGATPAAADPAKPTDYRSDITSIEPRLPGGVTAEIVGGDSFLQVSVDEGHSVEVEGYDGEPYLQFLDDGTVQQNQRSTATYLNEDRYGQIDVPESADNDAQPQWATVDDDGEYTWHDHRIHYMSPDLPRDVERGDLVLTNEVALVVDGAPTAIAIDVFLEPAQSPLPWIGIGLAAAAVALVVGWRRRTLLVALVTAGVGAVLAVIVGQGEVASVPSGVGESKLVLIVPVVGLVATLVAAVLLVRKKAALAGVALLAGAAALAGWALLRLSVLSKPVLPTDLPANLDRVGTTIAVAAAVAVAALTLHSGAVTPAPLTDDD